jgi:acid phosphatase family membrane protein YuiD
MVSAYTLTQWEVLIVPLIVLIISQVTKIALETNKSGFQWQHLDSYGGMPSSHTAFFVSISVIIGFHEGFDSPLFALALFTAAVFIRDAFGIRWSLGFHGKVLNHLIRTLPADEQRRFPKHLEERWGHTQGEVLAGMVLGVLLTVLLYALIHGVLLGK